MGRRAWLVAPLLLSGCHLLLPLSSGDRAPSTTDAPLLDRLALDRKGRDGPWSDARTDARPGDRGCVSTDQGAAPACLPAYRNPSGACKGLLWEETFPTDPMTLWDANTNKSTWRWSCGALEQTKATCGWVWATVPATSSKLATASYLVEGRITFRAVSSCTWNGDLSWSVGIAGRVAGAWAGGEPPQFISCMAIYDPYNPSGPIRHPCLEVRYRNSGDAFASWPLDSQVASGRTFDASPGKSYYLQLYFSTRGNPDSPGSPGAGKALVCRICDELTCIMNGWADVTQFALDPYIPTGAGSIGLVANGRAASFDYLRVYELSNP
jgi:hypothetical protein